ncbi:hypothetical protein BDW74DRAFT_177971 [Aspergillus multicolor]|uniref:uncharacterized protein n=1 Tax=Aspergillus multicolor TaxID=41759 RepID=UPI003CCD454F
MRSKLEQHAKGSPITAKVMARLLIGAAVKLFNEPHIPVFGTLRSPLEIIQASIRYVRDEETILFKEFEASLEANKDRQQKAEVQSTEEHDMSNEFFNIGPETTVLREVKGICDELNILKSLCEDQEHVWAQAEEILGSDDSTQTASSTPSDVKKQIIGMIHEAEVVQKDINSLLDLKHKQANLLEVKFARQHAKAAEKQAADTAKQGDTLLVFTVVTIVFLPLSFLTSLFALNISDFPHQGEDVVYQGWWIFPILFGVSAVVSGFFMTIAFQVNSLKQQIASVWRHLTVGIKKAASRRGRRSFEDCEV